MQQKNYYSILGLASSATSADIKKAYRRLALRYHPDKNYGGAHGQERFREIQEAYELLSDPVRRQQYDEQERLRHLHIYAPSYPFAKFSTSSPKEENDNTSQEENTTAMMVSKSSAAKWLKPFVLIIISILLMWLIIKVAAY